MPFSELQYSNRQAFPFTVPAGTSGETWTKEEAVADLKAKGKLGHGVGGGKTSDKDKKLHDAAIERNKGSYKKINQLLMVP